MRMQVVRSAIAVRVRAGQHRGTRNSEADAGAQRQRQAVFGIEGRHETGRHECANGENDEQQTHKQPIAEP